MNELEYSETILNSYMSIAMLLSMLMVVFCSVWLKHDYDRIKGFNNAPDYVFIRYDVNYDVVMKKMHPILGVPISYTIVPKWVLPTGLSALTSVDEYYPARDIAK